MKAKTALVASFSDIHSDPRAQRQIKWLEDAGFCVDTLGSGATKSPGTRDHFELRPAKPWTTGYLGATLTGVLMPHKSAFRHSVLDRIPPQALTRISEGEYDVVVLDGKEFLPLLSFAEVFGKKAARTRVHSDLYERYRPDRRRDTLGGRLSARYYRWIHRHIAHPRIDSRTVVNAPIGQLYAQEFGFPPPVPVRNVPRYWELSPTTTDPNQIRMVFHGMASKQRGFAEILEAMETLPDRFSMTFMLMPNPEIHAWLEAQIAGHPARDRIQVVPPAPMSEIPAHLHDYDLEVIFLPPLGENLKYALPNKFFEAIQGRLGVVVADGETMAPEVREWGNGVVVNGHDGASLRDALASLSSADVDSFKAASHRIAKDVNAEVEGRAFLSALGVES